ncbi:MAG: NADH-quinone oxidoreductase subunit J [Candidatus Limnocylindria bacterium]|nr:NADH-quinone oxidoreductase subunit J [Candidatus Limnocylindria bacterium]
MDAVGLLIFGALALGIVGAGLAVVFVDRITAAALLMAFTFLCNAGMFVLLGAETIAAFQVLIYVGAITVLILYGVMFTPQGDRPYALFFQKQTPLAGLLVAAVAAPVLLLALTFRDPGMTREGGDLQPLITSIFGDYVVPFELASVLLLAALVGAIVLVKRDEEGAP